jgi:formylglycine-generating enzyme required for sulfatase activity
VSAHRSIFLVLVGLGVACHSAPRVADEPAVAAAAADSTPRPPNTTTRDISPLCKDQPGMAFIPAGRTAFHSVAVDQREVDVGAFWLDIYETTVEDYRACVHAGGCTPPYRGTSGYTDADRNPLVCTWEIKGIENLPINCVDGDQHDAYCAWRGKRPPFSHELHWAARGRDRQQRYPWGDDAVTCDLAIADENDEDAVRGCGLGRPWPVGSRPKGRSRDGVFDLIGNVAEKSHTPFRDDRHGDLREACGASWRTRSLSRGFLGCSPGSRENYSDNSGFRCALDPGPLPPCTVAP